MNFLRVSEKEFWASTLQLELAQRESPQICFLCTQYFQKQKTLYPTPPYLKLFSLLLKPLEAGE